MATLNVSLRDLTGQLRKTSSDATHHGHNADIWRGVFKDPTSSVYPEVAIKVIRTFFHPEEVNVLNQKLLREARLWSQLSHENIVPFLGIATDMAFSSAPSLISPYYKIGNLAQFTHTYDVNDDRKWKLVYEIAKGLNYLHNNNVVHGDVKPANILINDQHHALLVDFGWSRVLELSGFTTKSTPGTIRYMSPELLDPKPSGGGPVRTSKPADVWAFAITVTEIFSRIQPYHHIKVEGLLWSFVWQQNGRLRRADYANYIPSRLWDTLEKCWEGDPQKRLTMKQFLS
ncbi:kinase-like domain-containing protein [Phlebopus sp. FC_14]|nr:kinase-like domain-containing protein [Phlebopus sp. FC_14]